MNGVSFVDTSVLLYADDACCVAATRKLRLAPDFAQKKVEILARCRVVRFETHDIIAAIELHRLTQVSFWDAMIVHAARSAGAAILYSEDFQAEAVLGGVRVVNPFVT